MDDKQVERAYPLVNLIVKYLQGDLNENDRSALHTWINAHHSNYSLFEDLTDPDSLIDGLINQQTFSPGDAYLRFCLSLQGTGRNT